MSSTKIQHRIDSKLKKDAESILKAQGIKPSQAIVILYTEIKRTGGFPFLPSKVEKPNKELVKDLKEAKKSIGIKKYKNKKDFFDSLKKM